MNSYKEVDIEKYVKKTWCAESRNDEQGFYTDDEVSSDYFPTHTQS